MTSEMVASRPTPIGPAMPAATPATVAWDYAVWIGAIDDQEFSAGRQRLVGLGNHHTARLLVRSGRFPRGFIEMPIVAGQVDVETAVELIRALPLAATRTAAARPPISVVLCTFDRPVLLAAALRSMLQLEYRTFEVIVVDNHPASGLTADVIAALNDPRISVVDEPVTGLARARNTGALAARYDLVAFTDDDVTIDPFWLQGIADGFAAGAGVACVGGIVASGEISTPSQAYFDRRVSWARNCVADVFALSDRRPSEPLFPFQVGRFGTGANFALRRSTLLEVGGFDEGLGIGSQCGGGEDIDIFVRVLLAGHGLAYEPSALVWHRHRGDLDSLQTQMTNYGTGLGAWLAKLALRPRTLAMMLRRLPPGLLHLRRVTRVEPSNAGELPDHDMLWRIERRGVLLGPAALVRARLAGARATPLTPRRRASIPSSPRTRATEET